MSNNVTIGNITQLTDENVKEWGRQDILRNNPDILKDVKALTIECERLQKEKLKMLSKVARIAGLSSRPEETAGFEKEQIVNILKQINEIAEGLLP